MFGKFLCNRGTYDILWSIQAVLETVVTLVRSEHMLQVVWKAVESWQGGVCGICCQGESVDAKVKPEWAIQLSSSAPHTHTQTQKV